MSEANGNQSNGNGSNGPSGAAPTGPRPSSLVDWENDVAQFEATDAATQTVLVVAVNRLALPARPQYSYRMGSYKFNDGKFTVRIPVRIERKPVQPVVAVIGINAALFVDLFRQADAWVESDCKAKMRPEDLLTLAEKRAAEGKRGEEQKAMEAILRKAAR